MEKSKCMGQGCLLLGRVLATSTGPGWLLLTPLRRSELESTISHRTLVSLKKTAITSTKGMPESWLRPLRTPSSNFQVNGSFRHHAGLMTMRGTRKTRILVHQQKA